MKKRKRFMLKQNKLYTPEPWGLYSTYSQEKEQHLFTKVIAGGSHESASAGNSIIVEVRGNPTIQELENDAILLFLAPQMYELIACVLEALEDKSNMSASRKATLLERCVDITNSISN